MTIELTILAWTLVLALVQIGATAIVRTRQYGVKWNAGARDEDMPPLDRLPGRLARAQANLFETLPLFIAVVLIAHAAGREGGATTVGCWLYLIARIVYLPLYAVGAPFIRSLVWVASLIGLLMVLVRVLGIA